MSTIDYICPWGWGNSKELDGQKPRLHEFHTGVYEDYM